MSHKIVLHNHICNI